MEGEALRPFDQQRLLLPRLCGDDTICSARTRRRPSARRWRPARTPRTPSRSSGTGARSTPAGNNADQARLMSQIAASDARFAVTTGDTAYDSGSQKNYGDLVQRGSGTSAVFGPSFWTVAGDSIAMFNAQGNHGMNSVPLTNWPQDRAVAASAGRYQMDTYCCFNGTSSRSYPSEWYAFDAGRARFYVLDAAWSNANMGDADLYRERLRQPLDLEPGRVPVARQRSRDASAFGVVRLPALPAVFRQRHRELRTRGSPDPSHLEGLLGRYGVDIVFNGHAHIYQRNRASATGMPVSYVTGGGGGTLEPVSRCSSLDQYAIGWSYSSSTHGSACGAATRPTTIDRVFHFLLVTVSGITGDRRAHGRAGAHVRRKDLYAPVGTALARARSCPYGRVLKRAEGEKNRMAGTGSSGRVRRIGRCAGVVLIAIGLWIAAMPSTSASAAVSGSLRRYPYLTDLVTTNVTVNWATTHVDRHRVRHLRPGGSRILYGAHSDRDQDVDHRRLDRRVPMEGAGVGPGAGQRRTATGCSAARPISWAAILARLPVAGTRRLERRRTASRCSATGASSTPSGVEPGSGAADGPDRRERRAIRGHHGGQRQRQRLAGRVRRSRPEGRRARARSSAHRSGRLRAPRSPCSPRRATTA